MDLEVMNVEVMNVEVMNVEVMNVEVMNVEVMAMTSRWRRRTPGNSGQVTNAVPVVPTRIR